MTLATEIETSVEDTISVITKIFDHCFLLKQPADVEKMFDDSKRYIVNNYVLIFVGPPILVEPEVEGARPIYLMYTASIEPSEHGIQITFEKGTAFSTSDIFGSMFLDFRKHNLLDPKVFAVLEPAFRTLYNEMYNHNHAPDKVLDLITTPTGIL